ncbi:MAG: polyprenyl synthetase family protein [FCB group bacterium]|nr:polyprenyl synthetase family protein [FCB group bacterium]
MSTVTVLDELYKPIQPQMEQVRSAVGDLYVDTLRLVHGAAVPRPKMGGKMLRPALCLLSAGATGAKDLDRFVSLATSVELFHLAALAHDDVIDAADFRHGTSSLNVQWDNHAAVLGGDYLVSRAIAILAEYGSCDLISCAIDSVRQMSEGELIYFGLGPDHFTEKACLTWARQKTASLFAVICSAPTYLVDATYRDALYEFGEELGIAFQLVDDVLDLCQDRQTLGKPACGDLVEAKRTIPILYLRQAVDDKGRARLDSMRGKPLSEEDREWVIAMMESTGARERTEALAREYMESARSYLATLPSSIYRDAMFGLSEFVLVRGS